MKILSTTIFLSCFMMSLVNGGSEETKQYCYDPPGLSCAEQHILDCDEGQVITTDIFQVIYYKNINFSACQTDNNECKNKTTCCKYISRGVMQQTSTHTANDNTKIANFIKTECSSKSSCIVSFYNFIASRNQYDYINYNYSCIPASKDAKTVDFLVNWSSRFTGNNFPTVYYLDYTGNGTKDNDVILNRECIITTTERDITLTIKTLNLQADECCLFYISGHNVSEYCSQSGSSTPPIRKYIGENTATIRLENVVNKNGANFSILVKAAGNVTIDCREIKHVDKRDETTVDFLVNGSTKFTGNSFPTVYYLDYTGNGRKEDNVVILNRECIITTTQRDITLTIKTLNLRADECCRFHISGHNAPEYCSQSVSFNPSKGRCVGKNTATIRLENVVNKDGDGFSILVRAAGNITIYCREIEHVDKQESTICQYPTTESTSMISSLEDSETNLTGIIGGSVGGLVVLVVIIIVVVVIMRRRRRPKNKVDENNYYSTIDDSPTDKPDDNPKGSSNYSYIDIDLDKVGYKTVPKDIANPVKSSGGKDKDPNEVNKKHPIFRRQDFSFVEGKFGKNMESKDDKKRSVPKEKANAERKVESEAANYTYIDDSMIKPRDKPSASVDKDNGQQNAKTESSVARYTKVIKKQDKFIPTKDQAVNLDNYNHVGLTEGPPRIHEQDQDNYNHIDFNFKKDNSLPKGSNSKPINNYNYTEIDIPQEEERDDTYDHAQQGGERIVNQKDKKEQNDSDTYNHIGTKNENYVYSEAKTMPDTYNHIGVNNNNSMSKGARAVPDTYNHIGTKNENYVYSEAKAVPDTYNHIGVNNSMTKGDNSDLDTYNHIGVNDSVTMGDNSNLDTYNHI